MLENVECFLENPEFVLTDLNAKKGALFKKRLVDEKREHLKRTIIAMTEKTKAVEDLGKGYYEFRKKMHGQWLHVPTEAN